ncbi:MAG: class I SAM-dependent methyltransferase [Pirellulaceae bacterium]
MNDSLVREHYRNFLGKHYEWMCGPVKERVAAVAEWFKKNLIVPSGHGQWALDLGCGHGIQSLALVELGFHVVAVDQDESLLESLAQTSNQSITIATGNLNQCTTIDVPNESYAVAVCMGDTLTHLQDQEHVKGMLGWVHGMLSDDGWIVLEFRELTVPLKGSDRIVPVRMEADKVMLAFLEYLPSTVQVHDVVLTRKGDSWEMEKSNYPKIRLSADMILGFLHALNMKTQTMRNDRGMVQILAQKQS